MARRVVVTGMGIVSCLGNDLDTVSSALRELRSGISTNPEQVEIGMRSHVAGMPQVDLQATIDRKKLRFMGEAAAYAYLAMGSAIEDAGLSPEQVNDPRTGVIAGSGGASAEYQVETADLMREKGVRKVGPYQVPRTMSSTVSANLATGYGIRGVNYSVAAACATSAHCIGLAADLIRLGQQDIVLAGGGEELHWALSCQFDAMGAVSSAFNDRPAVASRPYDADRDGFVIAGGAGMLVIEDYDHAVARGARIYGELVGYGATSDGADMVAPSGEGAVRAMRIAMQSLDVPVDYINTHGTSTPVGDVTELGAIAEVFGDAIPPISSTKALSGHSLGAASVHEAIYCLLMMRDGFMAGSAHIENLDPRAEAFPILRETRQAQLNCVLSNSFGFGGTNATLVFKRVQ
ncbi:beta-ketoacyl-ACP synthase I [Luteimonas sp. FXH3W]|uniref:3-oxoacyl-[acyl-carrier-protein] synthase 1 n=1 Tax=Aquilutibacter rugosus TaxID=3115820 RepID=A0ABU7V0A9_9GAMM